MMKTMFMNNQHVGVQEESEGKVWSEQLYLLDIVRQAM